MPDNTKHGTQIENTSTTNFSVRFGLVKFKILVKVKTLPPKTFGGFVC